MLKTVLLYILATIAYWTGTWINPLYTAIFVSILATIQAIGVIYQYVSIRSEQEKVAAFLLAKLFRSK
jgi:hypothetical protein